MKKIIYQSLWIVTGVLLGALIAGIAFIAAGFVFAYILFFYIPFSIAGAIFGWWVGPIAWKKVYVEGARGKKYVIKK